MTHFSYHAATLADLDAITDIYNKAVKRGGSSADTKEVSKEQRKAWLESHKDPYAVFGIDAQLDDGSTQTVGFAGISVFYDRPGYDGVCDLAYYIDPDWQGKGLGTYAVKLLLDECRKRGMRKACAIIFADNMASIHMMEKFEFTQFGYMPEAAYDAKGVLHGMSYWYKDLVDTAMETR